MAKLIPALPSVTGKMTPGERRLARRLESHLEDDYLCWYDVPVGARSLHPDFLVLHPRRGLLVVEVKDWKLESIRSIDKLSVTLVADGREKRESNPLEQARQYAFGVCRLFESAPTLEALKRLNANRIYLPSRAKDMPDRDRLAMRFEQFKARA